MKRLLIILLIFTCFNIIVKAEDNHKPRFVYGIEWGYAATFQSGYHYNFFAPEGYRVDDYGNSFGYKSNADVYLYLGHEIGKSWIVSLYAGYAGVGKIHEVIPVTLRATRFWGDDPSTDRWFAFIDAGSGISVKKPVQEIIAGKIGGGYRIALSQKTGLDLILALRMTYTHPEIIYDGQPVDVGKVNRSNAYLSAVSLGLSLSF